MTPNRTYTTWSCNAVKHNVEGKNFLLILRFETMLRLRCSLLGHFHGCTIQRSKSKELRIAAMCLALNKCVLSTKQTFIFCSCSVLSCYIHCAKCVHSSTSIRADWALSRESHWTSWASNPWNLLAQLIFYWPRRTTMTGYFKMSLAKSGHRTISTGHWPAGQC